MSPMQPLRKPHSGKERDRREVTVKVLNSYKEEQKKGWSSMSQTVIVFQDESILAAGGREGLKPRIQETYKIELSGYGDPFARWKTGLKQLKEEVGELKRVRLVLPVSMCQVKSVRLPYAKGKQLDAMVQREMQESFRGGLMDYAVIQSDSRQGVSIVAASVEKDVLKQFLEMCQELKIEVTGVTAPMEGIQRLLAEHKAGREQTAIYLFFEEEGLTSILMERGKYKYSGRNRLFSEQGTVDFGMEIMRNVSGILQFQAASKGDTQITDLYYTGCAEEDFEVSLEALGTLNLTVHSFGEVPGIRMCRGEKTSDWLLCIGAMMCGKRNGRSMNLAASYEHEKQEAADLKMWKELLPVAVIFGVCAVILGAVLARNAALKHRIYEKDTWIAKTLESEEYQQALLSRQHAQEIENTIREIEQLQKNLETYPEFNEGTIARIEEAGSGVVLKIHSYNADSGVMTFDAGSEEVIDIPWYIQRLEETDLFYKVEYTGYTYKDGIYTLSLMGILDSPQTGGAE